MYDIRPAADLIDPQHNRSTSLLFLHFVVEVSWLISVVISRSHVKQRKASSSSTSAMTSPPANGRQSDIALRRRPIRGYSDGLRGSPINDDLQQIAKRKSTFFSRGQDWKNAMAVGRLRHRNRLRLAECQSYRYFITFKRSYISINDAAAKRFV